MEQKEMTLEERLDRIKMHLVKLEQEAGGRCQITPRYQLTGCPIANFAPRRDKEGYLFHGIFPSGRVAYFNKEKAKIKEYQIYESSDSHWWESLSATSLY